LSIAAARRERLAGGCRLKVLMLMMPMPSLTSHLTGRKLDPLAGDGDVERLVAAGRTMVSLIAVPGAPRILSTASSSVPP
jgi:hypothetical protein